MGSHSDWAMCTTFSLKGDHVISGGRDMSVKLTEVAAQRFVDNVTSITPGALKGGVLAVATHPTLEHLVTAGSDGLPKVYRIFRETKREIGDDAQFISDLFPMSGRVFSARFSADGKRIACGSSLDGQGEVMVCSYDFTNDVPQNLRDIMGKVPGSAQTGGAKAARRLSESRHPRVGARGGSAFGDLRAGLRAGRPNRCRRGFGRPRALYQRERWKDRQRIRFRAHPGIQPASRRSRLGRNQCPEPRGDANAGEASRRGQGGRTGDSARANPFWQPQ